MDYFYDIIVIDGGSSKLLTFVLDLYAERAHTPVNHRKIVMEKVGLKFYKMA